MLERQARHLTRSVRISAEVDALLREISARERISTSALIRELLGEGLARRRLELALAAYQSGELNLGEAARRAGLSVEEMMAEVHQRGIDAGGAEHVVASLEALIDMFGGSPEIRAMVAERRQAVGPGPEESEASERRRPD